LGYGSRFDPLIVSLHSTQVLDKWRGVPPLLFSSTVIIL
jgi:hypothetical protein